MKVRVAVGVVLGLMLLYFGGTTIYDAVSDQDVSMNQLMASLLSLVFFLQNLTWGHDRAARADELGRLIESRSAKISYYIIAIGLFLLWIADRIIYVRRDTFGNVSLLVALCFVMTIYPLVTLVVARRYR